MVKANKLSAKTVAMAVGLTALTGLAGCSDETPVASTPEERAAVVERIKPVVTLDDMIAKPAPAPAPPAAPEAVAEPAPAAAPAPATSETAAAPEQEAPATGSASAKELYNRSCMACHTTGAAGAPKLGDKAAWEPRFAAGVDTMMSTAKTGKGAMPPNGASTYSEAEMRQIIDFMLVEAGLI